MDRDEWTRQLSNDGMIQRFVELICNCSTAEGIALDLGSENATVSTLGIPASSGSDLIIIFMVDSLPV